MSQLIDDVLGFCLAHDCTLDPVIDSSSLLRAWQTATLTARRLTRDFGFEVRVVEHDSLAERGLGSLANLSTDDIVQAVTDDPRFGAPPADWKTNRNYRLPVIGAESLAEAGERVARHLQLAVETLAASAKHNRVKLMVGHGASMRHAAVTLGVLSQAQVGSLSMHHCHPVFLEWTHNDGFRHIAGAWKERGNGGHLD